MRDSDSKGQGILDVVVGCAKAGLVLFFGFVAFTFVLVVLAPPMTGIRRANESAWVQMGHALGLALYSYANDNNQNYPEGQSSTEVFQKLLDGGYVTDPSIFYIPFPGKTKALPGQKLKPENVCWDVTCCVSLNDSGEVPLLFMTGYRVNYAPGGIAAPLIKPFPRFGSEWHSWRDVLHPPEQARPGIAVFYVNNSSKFATLDPATGVIPNFVPPDFDPKGKTYRQLTPDGALP